MLWEGVVEAASELLENQPRDQVATLIPISGYLDDPDADVAATVGNVLRNAFVRAYLPSFHGHATEISGLSFDPR